MGEMPNLTLDEVGDDVDDPRYFDRGRWLAILMGLHHTYDGDPCGFNPLDAWTVRNPNYASAEARAKAADIWASFDGSPSGPPSKVRKYTAATVFWMADRAAPGWRDRYHAEAERRMAADADNADAVMMAEIAAATPAAAPAAPETLVLAGFEACAVHRKAFRTRARAPTRISMSCPDAEPAQGVRQSTDADADATPPDAGATCTSNTNNAPDNGSAETDAQPATAVAPPDDEPASAASNAAPKVHDPARVNERIGPLSAMLAVIPNPPPGEDWNEVGMAICFVTNGSDAGLGLFKAWSAKSIENNNDDDTAAKWNGYRASPPPRPGKLTKLANAANPGWPALIDMEIKTAIEVVKLAALSSVQYDQRRKECAKRFGFSRVGTLDEAVEKLRRRPAARGNAGDKQGQQGRAVSFKPPDGETAVVELHSEANAVAPQHSEEALALEFATRHAHELRYVAAWRKWFTWDGMRWQEDETKKVFSLARALCREVAVNINKSSERRRVASASTRAAVVSLAGEDRRIAATIQQWDTDKWVLNTPAGVVDLRTGAIRKQRPEDYMTKITAVAPGGDCPRWKAFIETVTNKDVDLANFLQRMFGYAAHRVDRRTRLLLPLRPRPERQERVPDRDVDRCRRLSPRGADRDIHRVQDRPPSDRARHAEGRADGHRRRDRGGAQVERNADHPADRRRQGAGALHAPGLLRIRAAVQVDDRRKPQAGAAIGQQGDQPAHEHHPVHRHDLGQGQDHQPCRRSDQR